MRPVKKRFSSRLLTYFVNGVIAILPIGIVAYVVYVVFEFLDNLSGRFIRMKIGDYIPGLGLLITIMLIMFIGAMASTYISKLFFGWIETLLSRIPIVKSLYSISKETIQSILGEKKTFQKVVLVELPGQLRAIGFVTSEDVSLILPGDQDHIAVYLPQSFQMAGLTLIVPRANVTFIDVPVDKAMSFALSAGISSSSPTGTES